ncbi:hypothetical protein LEP1GSC018_1266 [Leptospira kirschneri str. 2008720114]|nr:hypothetical protein LEP1GSC018_1266 [Leptospira kirschneri str. 2008720114]
MVQYAIWRFSVQDFYSFFLLTPNSRYLFYNSYRSIFFTTKKQNVTFNLLFYLRSL